MGRAGHHRGPRHSEVLIMPDGRVLPWSDYGHHKCLGPDYRDNHVK